MCPMRSPRRHTSTAHKSELGGPLLSAGDEAPGDGGVPTSQGPSLRVAESPRGVEHNWAAPGQVSLEQEHSELRTHGAVTGFRGASPLACLVPRGVHLCSVSRDPQAVPVGATCGQ